MSDVLTVESAGSNHLYFYSEVNDDRCLDLLRRLREMDASLQAERLSRNLPNGYLHTPIWLHVNSGGGSMYAGFAAADGIQQLNSPVYSVIEGCCASAATLISMGCDQRYITPNGLMCIHQISGVFAGTHVQSEDFVNQGHKLMKLFREFYVRHSSMKRKDIRALMKRDSWLTADEALASGFVDAIME